MSLAVLSDSHGAPHLSTVDILREIAPDAILHAGDVGRAEILEELEDLAPTCAVRGNVDSVSLGLPDAMTVEVMTSGSVALRILLTHIGIARLRLHREVRALAAEHRAGLVVCGHSHLPWMGRDGHLVVFNPGSHGPRRFDYPVTLGLIEIDRSGVRLAHVDCETGERWTPG